MEYTQLLNLSTVWIADNVTRVLTACLILFVGFWLAGLLSRQTRNVLPHTGRVDKTLAPLMSQVVRYGLIIITVVIALSQFGIQTTSILAVLGAAGLAIALALQGTLSNIASGVMLIWLRPFNVGDAIDAEGISGNVLEVGLFATELRTYDGVFIFVPNSRLWNAKIMNYSRETNRMVEIKIGIGYEANTGKARDVLLDIARKDPRVLVDPVPTVHVGVLGAISVEAVLRAWTKNSDWWSTKIDLTEQGKAALEAAGIRIPYSQVDLAALDRTG